MPAETEDLPLPFSDWMARALFAPGTGYYSARIKTVGRHGDFSTSATIAPLLGQAVARWLASELARDKGIRAVIEVGGGDGSLSYGVRQALGWWRRRSLAWHMVETSPVLRERQQERLRGSGAQWHETLPEALTATQGRALIFHNELVDAFPVTLLQWDASQQCWQEIALRKTASGIWEEVLQPLSLPSDSVSQFSALRHWQVTQPPSQPKQRVELQTTFRDWLHAWASQWKGGAMLTIDYGDTFPALYHRRPQGTLRAYLLHQRLTGRDVYQNMGRQDITADVNFTDLLDWGAALGWPEGELQTQREFIFSQLPHLDRRLSRDGGNAAVADPEGAGEAFKVWTVRAGS